MSDVFVSYDKEDRLRAKLFVEILQDKGWTVFWDQFIKPGGDPWYETIEKELTNARCVIVLWSKDSIKSIWVREEALEALNRRILVPVLIDPVSIPFGFRCVQCANLSDWDGTREALRFDQVHSGVSALIGPSPK
jgi:hypothetical protein